MIANDHRDECAGYRRLDRVRFRSCGVRREGVIIRLCATSCVIRYRPRIGPETTARVAYRQIEEKLSPRIPHPPPDEAVR